MPSRSEDSEPAKLIDIGREERVPNYVVASGLVFAAGLVGQGVVLASLQSPLRSQSAYLLGVGGSFAATTAIITGGYWLRRDGVDADRYRRILSWYLGGLFAAGVVCLLILQTTSATEVAALYWLHVGTTVGGAVGLFAGIREARTLERELSAQRAAIESAYRQRQQGFLKHLHALVRHEVLNTTQVISGYASTRLQDLDERDTEYEFYETINDQSRSLAAIVEDIEILLRASDSVAGSGETANLSQLLERELEELQAEYPSIELEIAGEKPVHVQASGSLSTVLGYIIGHRIEASNGELDHVEVGLTATGETVTVTITDDGPPLPNVEIQSPFEQPPEMDRSHGWALYLTDAVVELYDGTVTIRSSESEQTTLSVDLPQAESPPPDADGERATEVVDPKDLF